MPYHFRDTLGTVFLNSDGTRTECYEDFQAALHYAYQISADKDMAVYVCRGSTGTGMPSFTEVACVRACK